MRDIEPKIAARMEVERKVIANLIQLAQAAGYELRAVNDGEERVRVSTEAEALEVVFSVDESLITFKHPEEPKAHCAVIVLGNDGWDCVSDASMGDRWDKVIQANADYADQFCGVDDDTRSYGPRA